MSTSDVTRSHDYGGLIRNIRVKALSAAGNRYIRIQTADRLRHGRVPVPGIRARDVSSGG
jgi:hypothetical protein